MASAARPALSRGPTFLSDRKLVEHYEIRAVIGEGAFGVVHRCKKKGTDEYFAVKMVDMVETPLDTIKREVEMLQKLSHPTVIKLHDVFYEKVFVCMVLELYRGGDMIQGMMRHWKNKGMIPIPNMKHLSKQMLAACAWLHTQKTVHRDIKGDNFLMDYKDVEHVQQRIYLSDFGTVREITEGERLTENCGTKHYWSPEFYDMNYGHKVDCWATGVVMFGLVAGKFPFKNEEDVKGKKLNIPRRCPDDGRALIMKLLERDEKVRLECAEALRDGFLDDEPEESKRRQSVTELDRAHSEGGGALAMKEPGANAGVAQRRAELVDRLQMAEAARAGLRAESVRPLGDKSFVCVDPRTDRSMTFEWRTPDQVQEMTASFANGRPVEAFDMINREVTEETVRRQLLEHKMKVDGFGHGQAKEFHDFVAEVQNGTCRLLLDATRHKHLVRAVDLVLLRVSCGQGSGTRILVETTKQPPVGGGVARPHLPWALKAPAESALQTAGRLSKCIPGLSVGRITWDISSIEAFEEVEDNPAYPGIQTMCHQEIIPGQLRGDASEIDVAALGRTEFTDAEVVREFTWMTEAECQEHGIYIGGQESQDFSALVYPPIGLEEEELHEFLTNNSIDTSMWGQGNFRSLADFSEELLRGESTLIKQANGLIARVVDIVVLHLTNDETGEVLVEAEEHCRGGAQRLDRLPAVKRRYDEHQFLAARRLVSKHLRLDNNRVRIDAADVKIIEEEQYSTSFPALPSIYRKRFMKAVLLSAKSSHTTP